MNNIEQLVESFTKDFLDDLNKVKTEIELENLRIKYLSRQGSLSSLMHILKDLPLDQKQIAGPLLNKLKKDIHNFFEAKKSNLEQQKINVKIAKESNFDVTAYKQTIFEGSLHPYTHIIEQLEDIFISMGFEIVYGAEVETEYHNFDALNIPADHPARDMQDTFWLTIDRLLMRTHTSTVQIHRMLKQKPPIAIVAPGRVYRNEATDASHDFMFMQLEGLVVDKNISLTQLFATVKIFLQAVFETKDLNIREITSYFPFVEPGVQIDMSCPFCSGLGCSVCKKTGWIEICGAGLVHPNVLNACGIDSKKYGGFAFGFGLTRLAMLKYGITDIRLLHSNKLDFLKQF